MKKNNILFRLWDFLFGKAKEVNTFRATDDQLVLNIDFSISEWTDPKTKDTWAAITLLKAPYTGIKIKYNDIGIKEIDETTGAHLSLNYDFLDTAGRASKTLEKDQDFNNLLFNVAYAMIMIGNNKENEEGVDEHLDREKFPEFGRNDIGKSNIE